MEDIVRQLQMAGICVDLLCGTDKDGAVRYGTRLRTFGKDLPKGKMIIAQGDTFAEAIGEAVEKAYARRWENTDWAARPWPVREKLISGGGFGF